MLNDLSALTPLSFFDLVYTGSKKLTCLPKTADFLGEKHQSDVHFSVTELGITIKVQKEFEKFDCFIDTRDNKNSLIITKFCHHFTFTMDSGEDITRFRGDDTRDLVNPDLLKPTVTKNGIEIFLPSSILFGYNLEEISKIGYTHMIEFEDTTRQHFSVSSKCYAIESHPNLWASVKL